MSVLLLLLKILVSFSYYEDGVCINLGDGKVKATNQVQSKEEIVASMQRMIRTLITLSQTLKPIPTSRVLTMKLLYYDSVTPKDYEPMYFEPLEKNQKVSFGKDFFKIKVGDFATNFHSVNVKVRTKKDLLESDDEKVENEDQVEKTELVQQDDKFHESETEFSTIENPINDSQQTQLSEDEPVSLPSPKILPVTIQKIPDVWTRSLSYILKQEYVSNVILADHLSIPLLEAESIVKRCIGEKILSSLFTKGSGGHKVLKNKNVERLKHEIFKEISHDPETMIVQNVKRNLDSNFIDISPKKDDNGLEKTPEKKEEEKKPGSKKRQFEESNTQDPYDYENFKMSTVSNPIQQKKKVYRDVGNISI